ncbi:MAG: hypothetical protein R3B93_11390 [Bacteroidia bacterium]
MEFLNLFDLEPKDVYSAILTGLITFLIFMAREFWSNWKERLAKRDKQLDIFRVYGYPLIIASQSLVNRLHEMFQTRPRFLRKDAPDIEFYRYNYISTLYRLCAVLGWIRAIGREISSLEVSSNETNQKLRQAISSFQEALASNHFTTGKQIDYLINRWDLDDTFLSNMEEEEQKEWKKDLERQIEDMVWVFLADKEKTSASMLKEADQVELLHKVYQLLTGKLQIAESVEEEVLKEYRTSCISVISRRVSWIYRDWQRAIGDYMLMAVEHENTLQKIGAKTFPRI